MIQNTPIFIDLDRRRQVIFNLNTEILIRGNAGKNAPLWETIGESTDPETGKPTRTLDVNLGNLRTYLWAALQEDAQRHDELLTPVEVGAMLVHRSQVKVAVEALTTALMQYYGDEPAGETHAPAAGA
jgi:hypothetical protein